MSWCENPYPHQQNDLASSRLLQAAWVFLHDSGVHSKNWLKACGYGNWCGKVLDSRVIGGEGTPCSHGTLPASLAAGGQ